MLREKNRSILVAVALVVMATAGWLTFLPTREASARDDKEKPAAEPAEAAAVRKTAEAFVKAFNAHDAKAVASFWTKEGEYIGADGETLRGREEIEKTYAEFFKANPKASVEVEIASVRLLGRHTALEEGSLKLTLPGEKESGVSRYSALHVREGDDWKLASVREWVPDPAQLITLKDVEWLIGEWTAKSGDHLATMTYAWDEDKAYIRGRYVVKQGDKVVSSGSQMLGKDPEGGLRSWQFDASGSTGEWVWSRDDNGWVIEAAGMLPDGSEVTAVNVLVPLGKDAFTWQSVERTVAGTELPGIPPVKVTRVKGTK